MLQDALTVGNPGMRNPGSARPCGYFGKVPARADFVAARLRHDTVERWDGWLQQALAASQSILGATWRELFLTAPIWRFILPPGACGARPLVGLLTPSVDAVGRCFPLMLAQDLDRWCDPLELMRDSTRWFAALETLALEVVSQATDLTVLDRLLPPYQLSGHAVGGVARVVLPAGPAKLQGERSWVAGRSAGTWTELTQLSAAPAALRRLWRPGELPVPGIWWMTGAGHMPPGLALCAGLVPHHGFPAFIDGLWSSHGWAVARADGDRDSSRGDDTAEIVRGGPREAAAKAHGGEDHGVKDHGVKDHGEWDRDS